MSIFQGKIVGKEQLILLPVTPEIFTLTTDPPGQIQLQSGIHAVVSSGLIGVNNGPGIEPVWTIQDDDVIVDWEVQTAVGPTWRSGVRQQRLSASRLAKIASQQLIVAIRDIKVANTTTKS